MLTIESVYDWYPSKDPIHGLDHVQRVCRLAERLAYAEGADVEIVTAAALLHDVQANKERSGCKDHGNDRPDHEQTAADIARTILAGEGWSPQRIAAVEHCIRAHRFRHPAEQPQTIDAQVLFDADKLDAIGAMGVARAIAYATQAGQPAYATPSESFLQTGQVMPGEPHSAYHEYLFKLRRIEQRLYTASGRLLAKERHTLMTLFFEQLDAEARGQ